jgi:hypothetical protein
MYTSSEIQAAVEKLVRASIRRPVDTLGVRRTDIAFSDVQEAAAGVCLLYPFAPFYIVALGAQRLRDGVAAELALIAELRVAIDATGRTVLPVEDVSSLFNAKAALEELEVATVTTSGFKNIAKVPAFQRFDQNIDRFLSGPATNVRAAGDIQQTPQQARAALPTLTRQLALVHADTVVRAAALAAAIDDYANVNLPSLVARGIISRSREVLGARAAELEALSPEERLTRMRDVTLDVLASRALVKGFGSFSGPTAVHATTGTATPFSDGDHEATPATVRTDFGNAFVVLDSALELEVAADGGAAQVLTLLPSYVATLSGSTPETVYPDGTGFRVTPTNSVLKVQVDNTVYTIPFTLSSTPRTAAQIATDLNTLGLPANVRAEPYFLSLRYLGTLDTAGGGVFTVPGGTSDLVALNVQPGDLLVIAAGPNAGAHTITGVTSTTVTVSGGSVAETGRAVEIGPAGRYVRIKCVDAATQVPAQTRLTILGETPITRDAALLLGFLPKLSTQCRKTTVADLLPVLNAQARSVVAGSAFVPLAELDAVPARTEPFDAFRIVFASVRDMGDTAFAGSVVTLTTTRGTAAMVGQTLVLRTGPHPDLYGYITAVSATAITATMISAGTSATGVQWEVGPLIEPVEYQTVSIAAGPNKGDYLVAGPGPTPLDVQLKSVLLLSQSGVNPIACKASLGDKFLTLTSRLKRTSSRVVVSGSAASTFFADMPASTYGTTPYVQLTQVPRALVLEDLLELFASDYRTPSAVHTVRGIETSLRVLEVAPELASNTSWSLEDTPPPYARLRTVTNTRFESFRAALIAWLARPANQSSYFTDFARKVNPLLVNKHPTPVQLGDAFAALATITGALGTVQDPSSLDGLLAAYPATPVAAVDTLLRTFKERGSDRATDLLLSGRFREFFALSADSASYAGQLQESMRAVAREDVPLRKTNRAETAQARLLSHADTPDFEFDGSDVEGGLKPDIPGDYSDGTG